MDAVIKGQKVQGTRYLKSTSPTKHLLIIKGKKINLPVEKKTCRYNLYQVIKGTSPEWEKLNSCTT